MDAEGYSGVISSNDLMSRVDADVLQSLPETVEPAGVPSFSGDETSTLINPLEKLKSTLSDFWNVPIFKWGLIGLGIFFILKRLDFKRL